MTALRLLVPGTGNQARAHAKALAEIPEVKIVAAVDRLAALREGFCATCGIDRQFDELDQVLDWGEFDAALDLAVLSEQRQGEALTLAQIS